MYFRFRGPTTLATTGPECRPTRIFTQPCDDSSTSMRVALAAASASTAKSTSRFAWSSWSFQDLWKLQRHKYRARDEDLVRMSWCVMSTMSQSQREVKQEEHFRNSYFWNRMTHYVEDWRPFHFIFIKIKTSALRLSLSHLEQNCCIVDKYSSKQSKHSSGQRKNNGKKSLLHGRIIGQSCTPVIIISGMPSFHSVIIKRWHQKQIITTHQSSIIQ